MTPIFQCSACQGRFIECEAGPVTGEDYCPHCAVSTDYCRPVPQVVVDQVFFLIVSRNYTRAQRNSLMRQFKS